MLTYFEYVNVNSTLIKAYYDIEPENSLIPSGYKVVPYYINKTFYVSKVDTSQNEPNFKKSFTTIVQPYKGFVLIPSY